MEPQKKQHTKGKQTPLKAPLSKEKLWCVSEPTSEIPHYMWSSVISLSLARSSQQLWDGSEDNDAAANLPQSYRRTADWFLNISLCVSLQMLRGK